MKKPGRNVTATTLFACFVLLLSLGGPAQAGGSNPYKVNKACRKGDMRDCKVNMKTYIGWRTFNAFCSRCHGEGALGSSIAPNLMKRITNKNISFSDFVQIVSAGKEGSMGVMPAWGKNPNVNTKFQNLWAYLEARTDDVLPPGRPGKLRND